MFTTNIEFNGLSSAIDKNRILQSQLTILARVIVRHLMQASFRYKCQSRR